MIKDDIYGSELRSHLRNIVIENESNKLYSFIYTLCSAKLNDANPFVSIDLSSNEIVCLDIPSLDVLTITNNKEVIARWCDMLHINKISAVDNAKQAYLNYVAAYKDTSENSYLFRAMSIVKFKKEIFKKQISDIFEDCDEFLGQISCAYPYRRLLSFMSFFVDKTQLQQRYTNILEDKITESLNRNDHRDAIFYTEALEAIGAITTNASKIRKSRIFEDDADKQVANKQKNTFYPNISSVYKKALVELNSVEGGETDITRISQKLLAEQQELPKMLHLCGVQMIPPINLHEIHKTLVNDLNVNSFATAWGFLNNFPIISNEQIQKYIETEKIHGGFCLDAFPDSERINHCGATVGKQKGDDAIEDRGRRYFQSYIIANLTVAKNILDTSTDKDIELPLVLYLLERINSKFIPSDRLYLYAQGIYFGLKNDYSLCAHILLPQIENSLRYIAQQRDIVTTKLTEDIQYENTMGGVLNKIKGYTNSDLWNELNHFLITGENFRNEVMHGLMPHTKIFNLGIYLWWLSIKMIYNTDEYFFKDISQENT